jgi:hypothetical protein
MVRKNQYRPSNTLPTGIAIMRMQNLYQELSPEAQQLIDGWKQRLQLQVPRLGEAGSLELIYRLLHYEWYGRFQDDEKARFGM